MNTKNRLLVALSAAGIIGMSNVAVAAVPHTFSAGTAAKASEVNENFSNLDTRTTALESGVSTSTQQSGFSMSFSAVDEPKNVVVFARPDGGSGAMHYIVRSRYDSATEQISINGVLTQRPFIVNYASAGTNPSGVLTYVNNYIEAPDTANYENYFVEQSTYDPATLAKTITQDDERREDKCSYGGTSVQCYSTVLVSATGNYKRSSDYAYLRSVVPGPLKLGNLTFTQEIQLLNHVTAKVFRIRAKGIGDVFLESESISTVSGPPTTIINQQLPIYYNVDGQTGGSLDGTPFAPGQPLDGLFF